MPFSIRTTSIIAALLISGAMVGVAFWLSGAGTRSVSAISTEDILRAYATKDTDADGLPDWQEALYGLDPNNPRSVNPDMNDAEAVAQGLVTPSFATDTTVAPTPNVPGVDAGPETLTDQFGRKFLENYLRMVQAGPLSDTELAEFVSSAVEELTSSMTSSFSYSQASLDVVQGGELALKAYAVAVENALEAPKFPREKREIEYIAEALLENNASAYTSLENIVASYEEMGENLSEISVPYEIQFAHLRLLNALTRAKDTMAHINSFKTDPLRGLVGLTAYDAVKMELFEAYAEMYTVFTATNTSLQPSEDGYRFFESIEQAYQMARTLREAPSSL